MNEATLTVHTPSGPENCCDKHAAQLSRLVKLMGYHCMATAAPVGSECQNCINEAAKTKDEKCTP